MPLFFNRSIQIVCFYTALSLFFDSKFALSETKKCDASFGLEVRKGFGEFASKFRESSENQTQTSTSLLSRIRYFFSPPFDIPMNAIVGGLTLRVAKSLSTEYVLTDSVTNEIEVSTGTLDNLVPVGQIQESENGTLTFPHAVGLFVNDSLFGYESRFWKPAGRNTLLVVTGGKRYVVDLESPDLEVFERLLDPYHNGNDSYTVTLRKIPDNKKFYSYVHPDGSVEIAMLSLNLRSTKILPPYTGSFGFVALRIDPTLGSVKVSSKWLSIFDVYGVYDVRFEEGRWSIQYTNNYLDELDAKAQVSGPLPPSIGKRTSLASPGN